MNNLSSNQSIDEEVSLLKVKSENEFIELKQKFHAMIDSLNPVNIIKDTLLEVSSSPEIKDGLEKTAVGIASGLLVKKVMYSKTNSTLKKLTSVALQVLIPYLAAKHYNKIKLLGQKIIHILPMVIKKNRHT